MATCRKVTAKERIVATERETGRKLTADEKIGLELLPEQYTCTGSGVGGLRGTKLKRRRRLPAK
jgi:hypothetical protein